MYLKNLFKMFVRACLKNDILARKSDNLLMSKKILYKCIDMYRIY